MLLMLWIQNEGDLIFDCMFLKSVSFQMKCPDHMLNCHLSSEQDFKEFKNTTKLDCDNPHFPVLI